MMNLKDWKITTPQEEGFFEIVSPTSNDCQALYFYRLNLAKGNTYNLDSGALEMNAALIKGKAKIKSDLLDDSIEKLDSFYIPGQTKVKISAEDDSIFYIGGAICEGKGEQFLRKFNLELPLGEIHQIHGSGVAEREVFFTLNPEISASRLICGYTWGKIGGWTSWPPHQHEEHLEEIYCYFDMPQSNYGFHISYLETGKISDSEVHVVKEGDVVLAPKGYHPTVATPKTQNIYFWILAALDSNSRRYDLAIPDPNFTK